MLGDRHNVIWSRFIDERLGALTYLLTGIPGEDVIKWQRKNPINTLSGRKIATRRRKQADS